MCLSCFLPATSFRRAAATVPSGSADTIPVDDKDDEDSPRMRLPKRDGLLEEEGSSSTLTDSMPVDERSSMEKTFESRDDDGEMGG